MRRASFVAAILVACSGIFSLEAATPPAPPTPLKGFPFTNEKLRYSVNWPSGLSLGEATLTANKTDAEWSLDFLLDAGIPAFPVADHYHSRMTADFCSVRFDKQFTHGKRTAHETTTVDRSAGIATRQTAGDGGKTQISVSDCARDALTFLYFARKELGQGRVPQPQTILFGATYQSRLEYTGSQIVQVGEGNSETDRVICHLKGPSSESTIEMFFARDAARTPLLIKVPFSMGTFAMELVR